MIEISLILVFIIPVFVLINCIILEYIKHSQDVKINSYSGIFSIKQHAKDVVGSFVELSPDISNILKFGVSFFVNTWVFLGLIVSAPTESTKFGAIFLVYFIYLSFKTIFESQKSLDRELFSEIFSELVVIIFIWITMYILNWEETRLVLDIGWYTVLPIIATIVISSRITKRVSSFNTGIVLENFDSFTLSFLIVVYFSNQLLTNISGYLGVLISVISAYVLYTISTRIIRELNNSNALSKFYSKYLLLALSVQGCFILFQLF